MNVSKSSRVGTPQNPKYIAEEVDKKGDVCQKLRYYTYGAPDGLVSGVNFDVKFTLNRSPKEVWPHFKDFNAWQNSYHLYYSAVLGDLNEGDTFGIARKPGESPPHIYRMIRVIPQHGMVFLMDVPGVMGGFEVFMLNEADGKTVANLFMRHDVPPKETTDEEAVKYWRTMTPEWVMFWRDYFIPTLKKLVDSGQSGR